MTKDRIFEFLRTELAIDLTGVDEETLLVSTGIVDSLALVDLVMFLETEAGLRIAPGDLSLEHFDTVGRMLHFLQKTNGR